MPQSSTGTPPDSKCSRATVVESTGQSASARVFGLSSRERLRRSFTSSGLRAIEADELQNLTGERLVALSTSHFYDARLIPALAKSVEDLLLLVEDSEGVEAVVGMIGDAGQVERLMPVLQSGVYREESDEAAGVRIVCPTDLVPAYDSKLRKHAPPFVLPASTERAREAEGLIFDASYKGITDFVTKWVWPVPARIVTGWCVRLGIFPNTVTALSYLMALVTLLAFGQGEFGIGLASAWLMTFLDTVDGKLARVTLNTSKLGDALDHGLDIIHPPLWWVAWAAGLAGPGEIFGAFAPWAWIVFVGYIVGRLLEGFFILVFGQEMFTWRPFDIKFRLVIARRNPNLVLLSVATLLGRPDLGLIAVGIWTLCCILVQCVRIFQAAAFQMRGREIRPFTP
jgi:phosphatidylglycerophosphate synthase